MNLYFLLILDQIKQTANRAANTDANQLLIIYCQPLPVPLLPARDTDVNSNTDTLHTHNPVKTIREDDPSQAVCLSPSGRR